MKIVKCEHNEKVLTIIDGLTKVVCSHCGQCRRFKQGDDYSTVITRLGRRDGGYVIPPAETKYDITPEESRFVKEGYQIINTFVETLPPQPNRKMTNWDLYWANIREQEAKPVEQMKVPDSRAAKLGRPQTGETLKCVDCGTDIYVKKYRLDEDPGAKHRCKKCAEKHYQPPSKRKEGTMSHVLPVTSTENATEEPATAEPAPKKKGRYNKRHPLSYWDNKREELMADYRSMSLIKFFEKWHLCSTVWMKVRKNLKIPKKGQRLWFEPQTPKSKDTSTAGILPPFPPFNNDWMPTVQEAWFKAYVEMLLRQNK